MCEKVCAYGNWVVKRVDYAVTNLLSLGSKFILFCFVIMEQGPVNISPLLTGIDVKPCH